MLSNLKAQKVTTSHVRFFRCVIAFFVFTREKKLDFPRNYEKPLSSSFYIHHIKCMYIASMISTKEDLIAFVIIVKDATFVDNEHTYKDSALFILP